VSGREVGSRGAIIGSYDGHLGLNLETTMRQRRTLPSRHKLPADARLECGCEGFRGGLQGSERQHPRHPR
jgi:hypothetical protein